MYPCDLGIIRTIVHQGLASTLSQKSTSIREGLELLRLGLSGLRQGLPVLLRQCLHPNEPCLAYPCLSDRVFWDLDRVH